MNRLLLIRTAHLAVITTAVCLLMPIGSVAAPAVSGQPADEHAAIAVAPAQASAPASTGATGFSPPTADAIPDNEFGEVVRKGQDYFLHTSRLLPQYTGNSLNCVNCHIDAGRRADSAPMWGAYVLYPAYRQKNGRVNTLAERLQGCFQYSMNGKAPAADSEALVAISSYMYWLASKAPTGVKLAGQGYRRLSEPAQKMDFERGKAVYVAQCAVCHGANGEGRKAAGMTVFPALWGDDSFNWGAGMHQMPNAAAFIKANMPLGKDNTLTDQQAWDVAYFMNSHERPQDPRFAGDVQETRERFHAADDNLYGRTINGVVLGAQSVPSGGRLRGQGSAADVTAK
jgi:thiosulfate dehydrogenase